MAKEDTGAMPVVSLDFKEKWPFPETTIAAFAPRRNANRSGNPPRMRLPEIIPPVTAQTSIVPDTFPCDPVSDPVSSLSLFFRKNSTIRNPARKLPHTIGDGKIASRHSIVPIPIRAKDDTREGRTDLTPWRR